MTTDTNKKRSSNRKVIKEHLKRGSPGTRFFIFLIFAAFGFGIFAQHAFNIQKSILNLILPEGYIQRQELKKILNIKGKPAWSRAILQRERDHPTHKEQLFEFVNQDNNERLRAYLLIPKTASTKKLPAVLCIHGHHSTKETVAGIAHSPYNINYGLTLVKENYITLIPDIRYSQDIKGIEDMMGLNLIMYGRSLTGERLKDLLRCIAFLKEHEQVDPDRIGVVGWSMGGGLALYLSAIDERVKLAYVSSYFGNYEQTVMAMRQSTDNYIPGIKKFGELYDVAALIAPRPLLIEHSTKDREFPVEVTKMAFEIVKNKYIRMGKSDKIKLVIREGGHIFYGDQLVPWFNQFFQSK